MFYKKTVYNKTVRMHKHELGGEIDTKIKEKLINSKEGLCGSHGLCLGILDVEKSADPPKIEKNTDSTFDICYTGVFMALFNGEVLDAIVHKVSSNGIYCKVINILVLI